MLRRLLSTAAGAVEEVVVNKLRVDGFNPATGLVLLRPFTLQDTGRVPLGSIVKSKEDGTEVVCLFKMKDALFGMSRTCAPKVGAVLDKVGDLTLTGHDTKKVFDSPPRDMERTPITQTLHVGIAAMDLMLPIGQGQSFLFLEKSGNQSNLFDTIVGNLPSTSKTFSPKSLPTGTNAAKFLETVTACAEAELFRDGNAATPAVLVVKDFSSHLNLWQEAVEMMGNPVLERSELRHFYSNFVQRAANVKLNENSLTLLLRMPPSGLDEEMNQTVYSLEDILQEAKDGLRPVDDFERLVRLRMKSPKLEFTGERLRLLRISPPSQRRSAVIQQNQEELMSIADGHINTSPDFMFDPRTSLTRIGTGTWHDTDLRKTLTKSIAGGLRLEISDLYGMKQPEAKIRLEAMKRALKHPSPASDIKFQCALVYAVKRGLYDQPQSDEVKYDYEAIAQLDLDNTYENQLDLLRKCVGAV
ncbi:hypothetical protein BASA81_011018 [Batrachochytrium salamandrivorans]|nr:hypothetical protein BASA81_011018 [Batrachochytrium salamandrivorans]